MLARLEYIVWSSGEHAQTRESVEANNGQNL